MKKYETKTKPCYLTTSPEKFQLMRSSGYCNMDSHIHTGKSKVSAILQQQGDSSLQSVGIPWPFPSEGLLKIEMAQSGEHTEIPTDTQKSSDNEIPMEWWNR